MSRVKRVYIHCIDRATRATNTIPLLAARIAVEPVGVAEPLGAIGGGVKVHESLSCERYWFISIPLQGTRACCPSPQPSHTRAACRTAYVAQMVRSHTLPAPQRAKELPVPLLQRRAKEEEQWVACVADARSWLGPHTHTKHTQRETRGGGA